MPQAVFLNVAEKPSVAREMARTLGGGNSVSRPGVSPYNQVYEFRMNVQKQDVRMVVTSVVGHLKGIDFPPEAKDWRGYTTDKLFDCGVRKSVADDKKRVEDNLKKEAKLATHLVCWLDCDREGENISFEVIEVCKAANPNLEVLRAKFSSLTARDLNRAMQTLGVPDEKSSIAVDARQEIDLRIGAVFTRFQTLLLRDRFSQMPKIISYGPCQFPTLGFVVSRYWEREGFSEENFWAIKMSHTQSDSTVNFKWSRDRLFDHATSTILYENCIEHPTATIINVLRKPKSKWRPVPLATVELQKLASRHLRFTSEKTMKLAEELYQETLFSYPRTETDKFNITDPELQALVKVQEADGVLGGYAKKLLEEGGYCRPRVGRNDDQAHPPIHPTKGGGHLAGDKKALYELVARHFLACCSKDATADEVVVTATCGGETFTAQGQTVTARNYLEIFIYERWHDSTIPNYQEGDEFTPTKMFLDESTTSPPPLLTETDLISTMDRNGIGTDATIAQHIKTIRDREYVTVSGMTFTPTKLGLALVQAYDEMGFASLALPKMRAAMESDLLNIVRGVATKQQVVDKHVSEYRAIYRQAILKTTLLISAVGRWYAPAADTGRVITETFSTCGKCSRPMKQIQSGPDDSKTASCAPCNLSLPLPKGTMTPNPHTCPLCRFQALDVVTSSNKSYNICPYCYSNPPKVLGDIEQNFGVMRCFQCSHAACPLATARTQVWKCPNDSEPMEIIKKKAGGFFIGCKGYKNGCQHSVLLPNNIELSVAEESCRVHAGAKMVTMQFKHGIHPAEWAMYCDSYFTLTTCLWCETRLDDGIVVKGLGGKGKGKKGGASNTARSHVQPKVAQGGAMSFFGGGGGGGSGGGGTTFNNRGGVTAPSPPGGDAHCHCNEPVQARKSRSDSNPGREYYSCGKCSFFKWKDEYDPNAAKCHCNLTCDVRKSNTDANQGRNFYKCPKRSDPCEYFDWVDAVQQRGQQGGGGGGGGSGGGGGGSSGFIRASDMR